MKKPAPKKPPEPEVEVFDLVEQGSQEWFDLRLGIPTSSVFHAVMANGRDGGDSLTRADLLHRLAGEILTGRPAEGKFSTAAMSRGKEMEPEARNYYARTHFDELKQVGFIRRKLPSGRWVGTSPDGVIVGKNRGLEIKTMAPHLMIPRLLKGAGMPPEHRAQVYGTMWVGGFDSVELMIYYSDMPVVPTFIINRDESYIQELSNAVEIFDYELNELVKRIRSMGPKQ